MARLCGTACALLVFSAVILTGLASGVSAERILLRGLISLASGFILGTCAGGVAALIIRDHLPRIEESKTPEPTRTP